MYKADYFQEINLEKSYYRRPPGFAPELLGTTEDWKKLSKKYQTYGLEAKDQPKPSAQIDIHQSTRL